MRQVIFFRFFALLLGAISGMAYGNGDTAQAGSTDWNALPGISWAARAGEPGRGHFPALPEEWLARLLAASRTGQVFRHPEAFSAWLETIGEPRAMTALATVARPDATAKSSARYIDPASVRNWDEFADPSLHLRQLLAGLDARIYSAIYNCLVNPEQSLFLVSAVERERHGQQTGQAPDGQWLRLPKSQHKTVLPGPVPSQRY